MTARPATAAVAATVAVGAAVLLWERRRRRILRETIACRLAALAAKGKLHEAAPTHSPAHKSLAKSCSSAPGTDTSPRTRTTIENLASPAPRPDFDSVADDKVEGSLQAVADDTIENLASPAPRPDFDSVVDFDSVADDKVAGSLQAVADDTDEASLQETRRAFKERNRSVVNAETEREVARVRARADLLNARAEAEAAAGVESFEARSRKMLELRRKREAEEAEHAPPPTAPSTPGAASPPPLPPALPGATEASVAAELKRWPSPPAGSATSLEPHVWPLHYDHFAWLDEVAPRYAFADAGEVLRHLVFVANAETPHVKKQIFIALRCGRCHAGAGASGGGIPKRDKALAVFGFQLQWLRAVQRRSAHPTVEKTVRVVRDCDCKMTS